MPFNRSGWILDLEIKCLCQSLEQTLVLHIDWWSLLYSGILRSRADSPRLNRKWREWVHFVRIKYAYELDLHIGLNRFIQQSVCQWFACRGHSCCLCHRVCVTVTGLLSGGVFPDETDASGGWRLKTVHCGKRHTSLQASRCCDTLKVSFPHSHPSVNNDDITFV